MRPPAVSGPHAGSAPPNPQPTPKPHPVPAPAHVRTHTSTASMQAPQRQLGKTCTDGTPQASLASRQTHALASGGASGDGAQHRWTHGKRLRGVAGCAAKVPARTGVAVSTVACATWVGDGARHRGGDKRAGKRGGLCLAAVQRRTETIAAEARAPSRWPTAATRSCSWYSAEEDRRGAPLAHATSGAGHHRDGLGRGRRQQAALFLPMPTPGPTNVRPPIARETEDVLPRLPDAARARRGWAVCRCWSLARAGEPEGGQRGAASGMVCQVRLYGFCLCKDRADRKSACVSVGLIKSW
eukprot:104547-Chlamydomonas_euryale.AAC.2